MPQTPRADFSKLRNLWWLIPFSILLFIVSAYALESTNARVSSAAGYLADISLFLMVVSGACSVVWVAAAFLRANSRPAIWFRELSITKKAALFAAIAFVGLTSPLALRAVETDWQAGRIRKLPGNNSTYVLTAPLLHPGDSTTYVVESAAFKGRSYVHCGYLLAPGVESVQLSSEDTVQPGADPNLLCSWALAPQHEGEQIIAYSIDINDPPNGGVVLSGYTHLSVKAPTISLPNISTGIGVASGLLSLYLLAVGRKSASS